MFKYGFAINYINAGILYNTWNNNTGYSNLFNIYYAGGR